MKYNVVLLLTVLSFIKGNAQTYEMGVFIGGTNTIADVGSTRYINPSNIAFGGILKWNRSPRHSFRATLTYADIEGMDSASDDSRRIARDFNFNNKLLEFALGIEYTFLEFDLHKKGFKHTPYLFTGISVANHKNYYFNSLGNYTFENTNSWAYGIPMALGYKARIATHIVAGAEIGARYTFSDEIDGSVPDADVLSPLRFGNTNNNDWYVFSGISLTFTFGRKPCYCGF